MVQPFMLENVVRDFCYNKYETYQFVEMEKDIRITLDHI